ncbi:MAG: hypothetical protein WC956_01095 [bacterium]
MKRFAPDWLTVKDNARTALTGTAPAPSATDDKTPPPAPAPSGSSPPAPAAPDSALPQPAAPSPENSGGKPAPKVVSDRDNGDGSRTKTLDSGATIVTINKPDGDYRVARRADGSWFEVFPTPYNDKGDVVLEHKADEKMPEDLVVRMSERKAEVKNVEQHGENGATVKKPDPGVVLKGLQGFSWFNERVSPKARYAAAAAFAEANKPKDGAEKSDVSEAAAFKFLKDNGWLTPEPTAQPTAASSDPGKKVVIENFDQPTGRDGGMAKAPRPGLVVEQLRTFPWFNGRCSPSAQLAAASALARSEAPKDGSDRAEIDEAKAKEFLEKNGWLTTDPAPAKTASTDGADEKPKKKPAASGRTTVARIQRPPTDIPGL